MKNNQIHIGKLIAEVCKQKNYKFADVAKKMGISKQVFNAWLKKDDFEVKKLLTISEILDYDFLQHFSYTPATPPQPTKVVLQIEISNDKTNEVLQYIQDNKLYNLLKN